MDACECCLGKVRPRRPQLDPARGDRHGGAPRTCAQMSPLLPAAVGSARGFPLRHRASTSPLRLTRRHKGLMQGKAALGESSASAYLLLVSGGPPGTGSRQRVGAFLCWALSKPRPFVPATGERSSCVRLPPGNPSVSRWTYSRSACKMQTHTLSAHPGVDLSPLDPAGNVPVQPTVRTPDTHRSPGPKGLLRSARPACCLAQDREEHPGNVNILIYWCVHGLVVGSPPLIAVVPDSY